MSQENATTFLASDEANHLAEAAVRGAGGAPNVDLIMRIPVTIKVVLGSATMPVSQLVKLGRGAIIPLDKRTGDAVDVVVNGQVIARGEIVVVDENGSRFGISLTEVLTRESRQ